MGWSGGSEVCSPIIEHIEKKLKLTKKEKTELYKVIIDAFQDADCDTLEEVFYSVKAPIFKKVFYELNPPEDWDD